MRCPRCRSEDDVTAQFCEECGAKLELTCPACGQTVGAGKRSRDGASGPRGASSPTSSTATGSRSGRSGVLGAQRVGRPTGLASCFTTSGARPLGTSSAPASHGSVAMRLTGHKTEAIYRRHAIVAESDLREGGTKLAELLLARPRTVSSQRAARGHGPSRREGSPYYNRPLTASLMRAVAIVSVVIFVDMPLPMLSITYSGGVPHGTAKHFESALRLSAHCASTLVAPGSRSVTIPATFQLQRG